MIVVNYYWCRYYCLCNYSGQLERTVNVMQLPVMSVTPLSLLIFRLYATYKIYIVLNCFDTRGQISVITDSLIQNLMTGDQIQSLLFYFNVLF